MKRDKRRKLSRRVSVYCIVLATALCMVLGGLGYYIYYTKSMKSYEMYIEALLGIVNSMVDADDMERCILDNQPSAAYEGVQSRINDIKTNTTVQYIYMIAPLDKDDITNIIYVSSAFTEEEARYEADELVGLGDRVQENAFTEYMMEVFNRTMFQDSELSFIPNKGEFGYMLTGTMPVINRSGKTVCLICIDLSMQDVYNTMYDYIISVLSGTILTAVIFLFIFIRRINHSIVCPIQHLAEAAADFVEQSHRAEQPEELVFQKVKVHTHDEIEYLADSISKMMDDTMEYMLNLTKAAADKERMSAELNVAAQIQESMIPRMYPAFPERSEFEIYGDIRSAKEMGGAFYDYFFIDSSHFGFFIGDVNHTGIPSALMMVITRTMIKNYSQLGYGVDKVCQETNNQLSGSNVSAGMTITAFIGIIDLKSGALSYVNAGHKPPYLKRSGGSFEALESKGCFALGSMSNVPYWKQTVQLVQGDMLFLYTNGVIGAEDRKGENYSEERMVEALNQLVKSEYIMTDIVQKFVTELYDFMDGSEQKNDIAVLLFRYFWG